MYQDTLHLATQGDGWLGVMYLDTLHQATHFCDLIRLFCLFLGSWSDRHPVVWRSFWAPFSSKFIFMKSSGCIVSNGLDIARFRNMIVEISNPEGRWRSDENSMTFFLKEFVSSKSWQISSSPFYERYSRPYSSSWFSQIGLALGQLRFWPVNYLFERKNMPYETI